jgi:cbb3-type cytochrome oxidase subunit 3
MEVILITIVLLVGTLIIYIWFFRTSNKKYEEQSRIPFADQEDEQSREKNQ